jgi:hypothetical protein
MQPDVVTLVIEFKDLTHASVGFDGCGNRDRVL